MLTLESLPRELRQEIFRLAVEHAIVKDIRLNHLIRKCIRSYEAVLLLRRCGEPKCLWPALESFAPSIHNTAACVRVVFPDLIDDIDYILDKTLKAFTTLEGRVLSKSKQNHKAGSSCSSKHLTMLQSVQ